MGRRTDDGDQAELERRADRLAEQLRKAGHLVTVTGAVSETTAAAVLGVARRTLRHWRRRGHGPTCFVTSRVWYELDQLLLYLDAHASGGKRQGAAGSGRERQIETSTSKLEP